ncbi:MAG TPA: SIMPL domain-containing protein [Candidatus Acidoferrales bacterium]
MTRLVLLSTLAVGFLAPVCCAQQVAVNRDNKTIEVTVTNSADSVADVAQLAIGYFNFGRTHDATYEENVRVSNRILRALLDAGVSKKYIVTNSQNMSRTAEEDLKNIPADQRKDREFTARQSWTVHVTTADASKVVDIAVAAGANDLGDPSWDMADPDALETKAYISALTKAHELADQMAKALGAKTGSLLYASNTARQLFGLGTVNASTASIRYKLVPRVTLELLPQKIEKTATVHAVFAIE